MNKWEMQMKEMSNQDIPDHVANRVTQTLRSLPKKKRYTKTKYSFAAIAVASVLIFSASLVNPAFAETLKSLPFISTVTNFIDDIGMKNGYEQGLSTPADNQYRVGDITVSFTETIYDGTNIYVGYVLSEAPEDEQRSFFRDLSVFADEKGLGYHSGNSTGERLDNGLYAGNFKFTPSKPMPDQFQIQLSIPGMIADLHVEKKGTEKVYATSVSKKQDGIEMVYKSITFSPTSATISFDTYKDIGIKDYPDYIITDDKGTVLYIQEAGGYGMPYEDYKGEKKQIMHETISVEPLNEIPESITIKPFLRKDTYYEDATLVQKKWNGKEMTLSQGGLGDITITDVTYKDGNATIHFTAKGADQYSQVHALDVMDENGKFFDAEFEHIKKNLYTKTFKNFPKESDITFRTREYPEYIYLSDLEVTIPIEK